jgi:hypothetical protein
MQSGTTGKKGNKAQANDNKRNKPTCRYPDNGPIIFHGKRPNKQTNKQEFDKHAVKPNLSRWQLFYRE